MADGGPGPGRGGLRGLRPVSAADGGTTEEVERLLRHGADVDCRGGFFQETALGAAAFFGHAETAKLLLQHGASVDAKDEDGMTPLHTAAMNGHLQVAKLLLQHSASVDAKDDDGETPLHVAAMCGHLQVVKVLVKHGASVDAKNDYGWTPLHTAAEYGHLQVAKVLLEHGARGSIRLDEVDHCEIDQDMLDFLDSQEWVPLFDRQGLESWSTLVEWVTHGDLVLQMEYRGLHE